jgi:hypothetical protein
MKLIQKNKLYIVSLILLALMVIPSFVYPGSPPGYSGESIMVNDDSPQLGGDLDLNGNDITGTGDMNTTGYIAATSFIGDGSGITNTPHVVDFGQLELSAPDVHYPYASAVYNGTTLRGGFANVAAVDGIYHEVKEAGGDGKFRITYTFNGLTKPPATITIVGIYNGSVSHAAEMMAFHCDNGLTDMNATTKDFPGDAGSDASYSFAFPVPAADYLCNGEVTVQIYHTSNPTAAHNMYVDMAKLYEASIVFDTVETPVDIKGNGIVNGNSIHIIPNADNGTLTIYENGVYAISADICGTGTSNMNIDVALYKNEIKVSPAIGARRGFGDSSLTGSFGFSGRLLTADADDVLSLKATVDRAPAHIAMEYFSFGVQKVSDCIGCH